MCKSEKVADLYELDYAVVTSNEDYGALDEALKVIMLLLLK
mgnify:CR=1 FL=1